MKRSELIDVIHHELNFLMNGSLEENRWWAERMLSRLETANVKFEFTPEDKVEEHKPRWST